MQLSKINKKKEIKEEIINPLTLILINFKILYLIQELYKPIWIKCT